ncbi:acyl-CoA thioesterase [Arthrobacter sp. MA-N2]|uniref:acyl-CoA thioesterase n=1 Tax=Arthrobacter sp. MA-N2 TaxID=1101188 RepID=UPI0004B9F3E3|nr:acyl-CoA thioesterase domain-containing protein [Arthrobacter sp. MA-N2]
MPATVNETLDLLEVEDLGGDAYLGRQPESTVLAKVFGGQVAAQLLASANRTVDADRCVHSLHTNYYLPGDWSAPIHYAVDRVRDGGSFSARQIAATQDGQRIATAAASYQRMEPGFEHRATMPLVSPPRESRELFDVAQERSDVPAAQWRQEFGAFEMRFVEERPSRSSEEARGGAQRIWFRFKGRLPDDPALETLVFTYISDFSLLGAALTPHGFFLGSKEIHRATLSHSIWYHGRPRPAEWFLYDQESSWAGGGRGMVTARVFTSAGVLVATTAQEGLIRPHGEHRTRLRLPAFAMPFDPARG